jgi:hypothetical protein
MAISSSTAGAGAHGSRSASKTMASVCRRTYSEGGSGVFRRRQRDRSRAMQRRAIRQRPWGTLVTRQPGRRWRPRHHAPARGLPHTRGPSRRPPRVLSTHPWTSPVDSGSTLAHQLPGAAGRQGPDSLSRASQRWTPLQLRAARPPSGRIRPSSRARRRSSPGAWGLNAAGGLGPASGEIHHVSPSPIGNRRPWAVDKPLRASQTRGTYCA